MPWFKVDDGFAFHRKAIKAGNAAIGLWVRAGSWCAQQLTDGELPEQIVALFGATAEDADRLVSAGLWDRTDDGYCFRGWSEYQPSRGEVEANRFATRERQSVFRNPELRQAVRNRDGDVCRYCSQEVQFTDRRGPLGGTYDHVDPKGGTVLENLVVCCRGCNARKGRRTPKQAGMELKSSSRSVINPDLEPEVTDNSTPTRPDPTRPVVPNGTTNRGAKRATQMPVDWRPKDEHLDLAREYGLDPAHELRAFKDRNEAKGTTYKNWDAAFRTWLNQAKTFRGGQSTSAASPAPRKHIPAEVPAHIDPNDPDAYAAWVREATR